MFPIAGVSRSTGLFSAIVEPAAPLAVAGAYAATAVAAAAAAAAVAGVAGVRPDASPSAATAAALDGTVSDVATGYMRYAAVDAVKARERGNAAFRDSDFALALHWYEAALMFLPLPPRSVAANDPATQYREEHAVLSRTNASIAALKCRMPTTALSHAMHALTLQPRNIKALMRAGEALMELARPTHAMVHFAAAYAVDRTYSAAANALKRATAQAKAASDPPRNVKQLPDGVALRSGADAERKGGKLESAYGKYMDAVELLRRVLPDNEMTDVRAEFGSAEDTVRTLKLEIARCQRSRAEMALDKRDASSAMLCASAALDFDSTDVVALRCCGEAYLLLNRPRDALNEFMHAYRVAMPSEQVCVGIDATGAWGGAGPGRKHQLTLFGTPDKLVSAEVSRVFALMEKARRLVPPSNNPADRCDPPIPPAPSADEEARRAYFHAQADFSRHSAWHIMTTLSARDVARPDMAAQVFETASYNGLRRADVKLAILFGLLALRLNPTSAMARARLGNALRQWNGTESTFFAEYEPLIGAAPQLTDLVRRVLRLVVAGSGDTEQQPTPFSSAELGDVAAGMCVEAVNFVRAQDRAMAMTEAPESKGVGADVARSDTADFIVLERASRTVCKPLPVPELAPAAGLPNAPSAAARAGEAAERALGPRGGNSLFTAALAMASAIAGGPRACWRRATASCRSCARRWRRATPRSTTTAT